MYVKMFYAYRRKNFIEGEFERIKKDIIVKLNQAMCETKGNCLILKLKIPQRKIKTFLNFLESSGFEIYYSKGCLLRLRCKNNASKISPESLSCS
jgi:hypothetical protein